MVLRKRASSQWRMIRLSVQLRLKKILFLVFSLPLISCLSGNDNSKNSNEEKTTTSETIILDSPAKKNVENYFSDHLLGRFNPKTDSSFALIPVKYCNREGMYLRKETIAAFIKMYDAAKKDGINLKIISATRNFNDQKTIWEGKWNGSRLVNGQKLSETIKDPAERAKTILRYSSMPGTSRHHWGTDMDLNSLDNSYFTSGEGKKVYDWLKQHASEFGFCQPYSVKNETRPNGYEEEKWHWSYMPLSSELLKQYSEKIKPGDISGFAGSETTLKIDVIKNYVKGINPLCR